MNPSGQRPIFTYISLYLPESGVTAVYLTTQCPRAALYHPLLEVLLGLTIHVVPGYRGREALIYDALIVVFPL